MSDWLLLSGTALRGKRRRYGVAVDADIGELIVRTGGNRPDGRNALAAGGGCGRAGLEVVDLTREEHEAGDVVRRGRVHLDERRGGVVRNGNLIEAVAHGAGALDGGIVL